MVRLTGLKYIHAMIIEWTSTHRTPQEPSQWTKPTIAGATFGRYFPLFMYVSSLKRCYVVKTALQVMFDGRIRISMKFCIEIHNPVIKNNQGLCVWERFWLAVGGITDRHMGYIRSGTQQSVKAKNGGHDGSFGKGYPNNYWSALPDGGFAKVWRKSENFFWVVWGWDHP